MSDILEYFEFRRVRVSLLLTGELLLVTAAVLFLFIVRRND